MASLTARRRTARFALALVVGLAAALPVPSLAAGPSGRITDDAVANVQLDEAYLRHRAAEHQSNRVEAPRGHLTLATLETRLSVLDAALAARIAAEKAAAEAAAKAAADAAAKAAAEKAKAAAAAYSGTNRIWIPSLGVSRGVSSFPCSRSEPPANQVYRWGCAGTNNVYLFGHAWGVMKPLHDAYVAGNLGLGLKVVYADGKGRVRTYRVTEIRVVTPDQVDWAIAAQAKPSMTLQTCVGARSERRLLVRLVANG
jgi:multidrug efflux pump subunit AcrA (membrane-fusion protein)